MSPSEWIAIAVPIGLGIAGWIGYLVRGWRRGVEGDIKALEEGDERLHGRINRVKADVSDIRENYVHTSQINRIEAKIDQMGQTIDSKFDRLLDLIINQKQNG